MNQGTGHKAQGTGERAQDSRSRAPIASGRRRALAVIGACAGLLAVSCGYHLVGVSSTLPADLKKLYVAPFVNQSGRPELDQRLTEQVTQEWVRRGRFQLVSNAAAADAVLTGTVVAAVVSPVRFDERGRANEYQLMVTADVQFVDRTGEKPVVLWHDARFSRTTTYQVDANAVNYFDREVEAMENIALDFARGLVVTILEGF